MTRIVAPRRQPIELEIAFFCIIVLGGVYVAYAIVDEPAGGHPFGHTLGIVGSIFMLFTEVAYSLRKRTRLFDRLGPMRRWLSVHIVTGIVGPFLVLMHTGLQFRGLAGFTTLLTLIVVASGFVGRYFYANLQRALQQLSLSAVQLDQQLTVTRQAFEVEQSLWRHLQMQTPASGLRGQWLHRTTLWQQARRRRQAQRDFTTVQRNQASMARTRERVARWRNWLRLWHVIHIPIGITLFVSLAIHIGATVYFRAGLFG